MAASPRGKDVSIEAGVVQAIRNLFKRNKKKQIVCGATKYGCDPRGGVSTVAPVKAQSATVDDYALVSPGVVGTLHGGAGHLNALLDDAGDERAVVLKFKREGCPACNSTIAPLASAASAYAGRIDFVDVDYNMERPFCKACELRVVPCAHIYIGGELVDAMALGPRAWAKFAQRLTALIGEPDFEILAAEIPADKSAAHAKSVTGIDKYL